MTTALAVIAPRLRKLILMLSSDYDAEIVTAARSIGRVLADAGSDWHQFADAVTQKTRTSILCDDWRAMAQFCRGQAHRLTPREFDFINNIAMRGCEPSEKQWKWLRGIFSRLGGEP
jgi:hypothetical protein